MSEWCKWCQPGHWSKKYKKKKRNTCLPLQKPKCWNKNSFYSSDVKHDSNDFGYAMLHLFFSYNFMHAVRFVLAKLVVHVFPFIIIIIILIVDENNTMKMMYNITKIVMIMMGYSQSLLQLRRRRSREACNKMNTSIYMMC